MGPEISHFRPFPGLAPAAVRGTTLWVGRTCQNLTRASVEKQGGGNAWGPGVSLLPSTLFPISAEGSGGLPTAHLNRYLFFYQNLTQVTLPKHFPKIESNYIHYFPFISSSDISID